MSEIQIAEFKIPEGKELLEDTFLPVSFELVEGADPKKPRFKGKFGQVDEATANKRVYPRKVMGGQIDRIQESIENGSAYGELDHPSDGKTRGSRVSHRFTELRLEDDGRIYGAANLIPGTINGDQAIAILRDGGKLGISSRGYGTTVADSKGNQVVQEDYQLVTFDLVVDPANAGAFPDYVVEDREVIGSMDLETLKKEHPELVEALRKETEADARDHARNALKEDFEGKLAEATEAVRDEALEEARKELLSDPEVAGAKAAMAKIRKVTRPFILGEDEESLVSDLEERLQKAERRIAEADEARREADEEKEELAELAKEAFFHLYLERTLSGDDRREQVESILGDVMVYDSLTNLKERVEEIQDALAQEDEIQEERDRDIARLEAENRLLEEKLEKALVVGNQFAVRAYIENRLSSHPKALQARKYLNEACPETKEDVDELLESFNDSFPVSDEYEKIRRDLESGNGRGRTVRQKLTESGSLGDVLGVGMEELLERAGQLPKETE